MATLNLQPNATDGKDSYIISSSPNTNGDGSNLHIGESSGGLRRTLIQFNLSSIPAGSTINSATLSLYFYDYTVGGNRTIKVYRLKRVWVENQVTWNEYATGSAWQTAGALGANDYDSTEVASLVVTDTYPAWQAWTLSVALVKEMISGGAFGNYGFLLIDTTESGNTKLFRSSDDGGGTLNPKLDIDYTAPATATSSPRRTLLGVGI